MPFETTRVIPNYYDGKTYIESKACEALERFELAERATHEAHSALQTAQIDMAAAMQRRDAAKEALLSALAEHYAPEPMPAAMIGSSFVLIFVNDDLGSRDIDCFKAASRAELYKIEAPQPIDSAAVAEAA